MTGRSGGANDNNFTVGIWCQIQDGLQTIADCQRIVEELGGVKFGAPSHMKRTHRREFDLGHYGKDTEFSKSSRAYLPPQEFKDLLEDLIMAREAAYAWARARYEELFGPAYVQQCREAGQWEQREVVPQRDEWLH